ncbi:3-isopropylmalate dehydrogenase [Candidatus Woesearchaeota archaeon]|nr:3-isopropylmalate dehydrogenase [Candidatus Woesearchaeota archaeon]
MKTYKIAVLPGDGIGPEIMKAAQTVLDAVSRKFNVEFNYTEADVGGVAIEKHGTALPKETVKICENSDAILFGAVGDPRYDDLPPEKKIEPVALLGLRKHFDLFANLRPSFLYPFLYRTSPLKESIVKEGFDILIVRELTSDAYFGKKVLKEDMGSDEMLYRKPEVERIAKTAFEAARKRKKYVTCVDKSNVLSSSILFRRTVTEVAKKYPDVKLDYLFIDNATTMIIKRPKDFDVMVTTNMFGDILSDEAAMLSGSLGMLPSASINEKGFGMYEPAGGSAPKMAGKNTANPIAQILSAALMLRHSFKMEKEAQAIESAVQKTLHKYRTKDIMEEGMEQVGTKEMGEKIAENIGR